MSGRPTMRDVAEAAGVSLMTVSRVVNAEPGVQPETAARVERAIRRLGYQRNDAARQLRRKGQLTQTIGLLVDDLANPFFSALSRAVEDEARLRSYVVLIGSSNDDLRREREVVSAFSARRVDGLIVVPVGGNHRFLKDQIALGTKVVCVDRPADNLTVDTVVVDNRNGAHKAVSHLLDQGHRRIAFLGERRNIWTLQERFAGFTGAFSDRGLQADPALIRHELRTVEEASEATAKLLSLPEPPTAILAGNDVITMGAVEGMAVISRKAALIGFDEFALASRLDPPITVVAQDPVALGATAAQLLFARIGGDTSPPRDIVLLTRLVVRGSGEIAPPPGEASSG